MTRYQVLDACCGSRMFWFDPDRRDAVFADNRIEMHSLKDKSSRGGFRTLNVRPSVVADFRKLPFLAETFSMVVFDPPHFMRNGETGWMAKKYGTLNRYTWRDDLQEDVTLRTAVPLPLSMLGEEKAGQGVRPRIVHDGLHMPWRWLFWLTHSTH